MKEALSAFWQGFAGAFKLFFALFTPSFWMGGWRRHI